MPPLLIFIIFSHFIVLTSNILPTKCTKLIRRANASTTKQSSTGNVAFDEPSLETKLSVAEGGLLIHTPAPTSCTLKGDADLLKSYQLARGGSLVAVDMFTRSQTTTASTSGFKSKASGACPSSTSFEEQGDYMMGRSFDEECKDKVSGRARLYSDSDTDSMNSMNSMDSVKVRSRLRLFCQDDLIFEDMFDLSSTHSFTLNMKVRGLVILAGPRALTIRQHAENLLQAASKSLTVSSSFRHSLSYANQESRVHGHGTHTIHAIASASKVSSGDSDTIVIRFTAPTVDDAKTFVYTLLHPLEGQFGISLDAFTVMRDAELKVFYVPPPITPRTLSLSHPPSFPLVRFQSFNTLDTLERDGVKRCTSDNNLSGKRISV